RPPRGGPRRIARRRDALVTVESARASSSLPAEHQPVQQSARIAARFASLRERDEAAFIPFLMAGDRGLDTTGRLLEGLVEAGADVIELGMPFSDPNADGPVHQ